MTVPKSKVLSVSKGLVALADVKTGCPTTNNSQNVFVNVLPHKGQVDANVDQHTNTRKAIIDGEEVSDVVIVEPTKPVEVKYNDENPYANLETRDLSTAEDIKNDYQQLEALVKTKDSICKALSIMLNLVENNPLIVNKYIIAPNDILSELIRLLTESDSVEIKLTIDDIGCSCSPNTKYGFVDKIYVKKGNETKILKYSYPEAIKILDDHRISIKFVAY